MNSDASHRWFWLACLFEGSLLILAALIAYFAGRPLWADFHWNAAGILWGLAGTVPPFAFFLLSLRWSWKPIRDIRENLQQTIGVWFRDFSMFQLAILSVIAGVAEEILFRSVIQGALSGLLGTVGALVVASALFGCAHWVSLPYAVFTGIAGLYLGGFWLITGNLLTVIVVHALYDFLALAWFLRKTDMETTNP